MELLPPQLHPTVPPRGGFHLASKYSPTIASNASMSASVGRMTVPQCFISMCESHGKYPRIPQVYQSHVRSHVGILLFSSLTGQGLKFGAKISCSWATDDIGITQRAISTQLDGRMELAQNSKAGQNMVDSAQQARMDFQEA